MGTDRLEAFSDGVMAVIITIMAFSLKTPLTPNIHGFEKRVPELLVYILSFTFIAIYWVNHHHLLRVTSKISAGVMWANVHLLFWLSLIPFATAWIGAQHQHTLPAAAFGIVALGSGLAYSFLCGAILRANADDERIVQAVARRGKDYASIAIYTVGVFLAFVNPNFSYACYVIVAVVWFVPDRRLAKVL
jgi:uncharacterized membrane protein